MVHCLPAKKPAAVLPGYRPVMGSLTLLWVKAENRTAQRISLQYTTLKRRNAYLCLNPDCKAKAIAG